jgi:hypothetical protein
MQMNVKVKASDKCNLRVHCFGYAPQGAIPAVWIPAQQFALQ